MDVISATSMSSSSLNPNAPMFVPMAYRTVEDFSEEWWALVHSSPWFRDYWLQERFHDDDLSHDIYDPTPSLFDEDEEFDDIVFFGDEQINTTTQIKQEEEDGRDNDKGLIALGALKWEKGRSLAQAPRYTEKAPKIVNVKMSPRMIQQPR